MENNITWLFYLRLIIALVSIYIILRILKKFVPQFIKRKSTLNNVERILDLSIEFYKPLMLVIALIGFVAINYIANGIIVLASIIILFNYIKSYISGVFFKIQPLVEVGVNISTGSFTGEISKLDFFGILIREIDGNRFINYSFIDKNGYSINQNTNASMRKIIYLTNDVNTSVLFDLLFDNPIVDFRFQPILKRLPNDGIIELYITLERGVNIDTLIAYLNQNQIKASLTN